MLPPRFELGSRAGPALAGYKPAALPIELQEPDAPGRTRTCDLWFRKPMLYPTELRMQKVGGQLASHLGVRKA